MSLNLDGINTHLISTDETGNSTKTLLTGSATFTGAWEDVTKYTTVAVAVIGSLATDGTLYIESSQDGGTVVNSVPFAITDATFKLPDIWNIVESHIRIRYTNGTTAQTGTFQIQTKYSNTQNMGLLQSASNIIDANTSVQVRKSITTGTDPNMVYKNGVVSGVDDGNSSSATLGGSAVFTGTWQDISGFHGLTVLVDGTSGGTSDGVLEMQFSHDGSTVHRNITIAVADITAASPRTLGAVAKYFRVIYTNGTTATTSFDLQTMCHTEQVSLVGRLDSTLGVSDDVQVVRAVNAGQQPSNSFRNDPANGVAISTSSTLAGAAVFTSAWIDSHGYNSIETFLTSDVISAVDGICIDFTDDLSGTPTVRHSDCFTFDANDVAAGFRNIFIIPKMVGFRIVYTNGAGSQSSFILQTDLKTNGIPATPLDTILSGNEDAQLVRDPTNAQLEIAREHIGGQEAAFISGSNSLLTNGSYEDIWAGGGDIQWQTTAAKIKVQSTDAADTSAGLGCRSVEIHGLSATGADQKETISLNGTTAVESALTYVRVNLMHNEEVGTYGGSHKGDVEVRVTNATFANGALLGVMTGAEGAVDTSVQYGFGELSAGFFSCPLGKVAYLTRLEVIPHAAKSFNIKLYERDGLLITSAPFQPRRLLWSADQIVNNPILKVFESHIKIKALTDVFFRAEGNVNSAGCTVWLDYYLVDADADGQ